MRASTVPPGPADEVKEIQARGSNTCGSISQKQETNKPYCLTLINNSMYKQKGANKIKCQQNEKIIFHMCINILNI